VSIDTCDWRLALTGVPGVVDGLVRLDEDVPVLEGHHHHPRLLVVTLKVDDQGNKLVPALLWLQTGRGELRGRNGKLIAFISSLLSKELYSIASHSPIHTPTAVPTMQGNRVRWCLAQGHLHT